jgi:outer membrane protein
MFYRYLCAVLLFASVSTAAAQTRYTLDDCLRIARGQNPDVLIAARQIDVARGNVTTAKAGMLPSLRTDGYFQERQQSLATSGGTNANRPQDYTLTAAVTQNLYAAGAVRGRIAISKTGEQIAIKNYQAAVDTMTLNVKLAFYRVLFADAALRVRREAVQFLDSQLRDQQDRLRAGTVGSLNVTRAQVTLSNERPLLYQAEADRATAYLLLAQVMGVALKPRQRLPEFTVLGSLVHVQRRFSLAECLARAAANRPEIEARRLDILALETQVIVEKSATRPQVNAFGAYQLFSEPNPALSPSYFSGFTVGLNFSWTLFDGFATPGRVHSVTARISAARQALRATELAVETEVRSGLESLYQAEETIRSQQENASLALESLALATGNFNAGIASQLDLLQGQVDLTRARLLAVTGRFGYLNAVARIERAMGSNDQKVVVPEPAALQR